MIPHGPRLRALLALLAVVGVAHWLALGLWLPQAPKPAAPASLRVHTTPAAVPVTTVSAVAAEASALPPTSAHTALPIAAPRPPARPEAPAPKEPVMPAVAKGATELTAPAAKPAVPSAAASAAPALSPSTPAAPPDTAPPASPVTIAPPSQATLPAPSPAHGATAPGHLAWPPAATLHYDVRATRKGLGLNAEGVLTWQPQAGAYQARLDIRAPLWGQRTQTSVGTLDPVHGLQPTRFGDKTRSERATHFDRTRTPPVLRFSSNAPDVPLQPHTQDRLSVLLQLGAMLAGEPQRFGAGSTVALHTAGSREADVWHFSVGHTAPLELPVGTLQAIQVQRDPLHPYDNRLQVWLAPALHHLPVRILITQANGDTVDQRLREHNLPSAASP